MQDQSSPVLSLNPFALPTETDARFILLIMSSPALAFALSLLLRFSINPDAANPFEGVPPAPGDLPLDESFLAQVEYGIQLMQASLFSLILPVVLIGITFGLTAILYRLHPRRILRRNDAIPFTPQSDVRFEQELATLVAQACRLPRTSSWAGSSRRRMDRLLGWEGGNPSTWMRACVSWCVSPVNTFAP